VNEQQGRVVVERRADVPDEVGADQLEQADAGPGLGTRAGL
jgi:hypothetical protein